MTEELIGAPQPEPLFMGAKEVAQIMGLSTRTVTRMCEDKQLPAVKLRKSWRINRAECMKLLGLA